MKHPLPAWMSRVPTGVTMNAYAISEGRRRQRWRLWRHILEIEPRVRVHVLVTVHDAHPFVVELRTSRNNSKRSFYTRYKQFHSNGKWNRMANKYIYVHHCIYIIIAVRHYCKRKRKVSNMSEQETVLGHLFRMREILNRKFKLNKE